MNKYNAIQCISSQFSNIPLIHSYLHRMNTVVSIKDVPILTGLGRLFKDWNNTSFSKCMISYLVLDILDFDVFVPIEFT